MHRSRRYEETDCCRACGGQKRIEILALGEMPLSNALLSPSQLIDPEPRFPLTVLFCPDCSLVQIRETVDPTVPRY